MGILEDQLFCVMGSRADDGFVIYDIEQNKILYQNAAFEDVLGSTADLIKADPRLIMNFIHQDDKSHLKLKLAKLSLQDFVKVDFRVMNEGREQFFRTSIAMAQWAGGRIACAIIEDSTVAYHNKIHIEQINARKNVTLEVLSHDIKEPLGMIKMIVSSLEKDITPADIKLGQSLQFIREMCERNLKLIRSMVNHEFLKSTVIELQKKRADLVWEIQDVIRFYKRSNLSDSRQFDFSASQDKIYIDIDSMKFMQVINNLISNAIKFTNFGGQIAVEVLDRGDSVRISVGDNGIGIPESIRSGIFYADKQALRDGLDGQPSGGLGLGIAKKIVELHNGTISFVSEVDAGTTFFIDLPKNLV